MEYTFKNTFLDTLNVTVYKITRNKSKKTDSKIHNFKNINHMALKNV